MNNQYESDILAAIFMEMELKPTDFVFNDSRRIRTNFNDCGCFYDGFRDNPYVKCPYENEYEKLKIEKLDWNINLG